MTPNRLLELISKTTEWDSAENEMENWPPGSMVGETEHHFVFLVPEGPDTCAQFQVLEPEGTVEIFFLEGNR